MEGVPSNTYVCSEGGRTAPTQKKRLQKSQLPSNVATERVADESAWQMCKTKMTPSARTNASIVRHNTVKKSMTVIVSYVGDVPVIILIRTDTTLDHSQKAEKV